MILPWRPDGTRRRRRTSSKTARDISRPPHPVPWSPVRLIARAIRVERGQGGHRGPASHPCSSVFIRHAFRQIKRTNETITQIVSMLLSSLALCASSSSLTKMGGSGTNSSSSLCAVLIHGNAILLYHSSLMCNRRGEARSCIEQGHCGEGRGPSGAGEGQAPRPRRCSVDSVVLVPVIYTVHPGRSLAVWICDEDVCLQGPDGSVQPGSWREDASKVPGSRGRDQCIGVFAGQSFG